MESDIIIFLPYRCTEQGRAKPLTDRAFDSRSGAHFINCHGVLVYLCKVMAFSQSGNLCLAAHSPLFGLRFSGGIHAVVAAG